MFVRTGAEVYINHGGPVVTTRTGRSGGAIVAAILLWVFVGWPMSWLLLVLFVPLGILFGVGITVGTIVFVATSPRSVVVVAPPPPPALPLLLPAAPTWQDQKRREIESLAFVNTVGGCGWCGWPVAHIDGRGQPIHPRRWHASEIEDRVRSQMPH